MRIFAAASISLAMAIAALPAAAQFAGPRPPAGDGGGAASGRIERLEQQITDLRGVVAAVETLAKSNSGGGSGYAAAGGGANSEQVRQLSEQIADSHPADRTPRSPLGRRRRRWWRRRRGRGAPGRAQAGPGLRRLACPGFEDKQPLAPLGAPAAPAYAPRQQQSAVAPRPAAPAPAAAAAASGPARALFDQGYGALNRREYSAAEGYFQQFLDQYPSDPLAGSAQYWLGESAFVSGEYKSAADRFLKTFTTYPSSERAPEALLKLAISLRRLGNNADACATFGELVQRYPKAPQNVLQRADAEKKRANCS